MLTQSTLDELNRIEGLPPAEHAKLNWDIISVLSLLCQQGRISDNSFGHVLQAADRLARNKPLTPLTGEDAEWQLLPERCTEEETVLFNKRCPSVIKKLEIGQGGQVSVVDLEAVTISSDGGFSWWDKEKCEAQVNFPYMPPATPQPMYVRPTDSEAEFEVITSPEEINALHSAAVAKLFADMDLQTGVCPVQEEGDSVANE